MGQKEDEQRAQVAEHRRQAIQYKQKHKVKDAPHLLTNCSQLGSTYGVGIGLYFQTIAWLRVLLLWLALASVPYLIIINTSQFTTAEHKGQMDGPGVAVLPSFNPLQSFTFAAIMDDARDKGILAWMNIKLPGFQGVFTMSRPLFLGWISLVDAGSMAVFSVACMVLYKYAARFVQDVDDSTMEVSDYTVVIKGLPETTPIDIGQHFRRFGKVMDVVMVKDFGPLLNLASTATALEQQRRAAEDRAARGHNAVAYQRQVKASEKKMAKFMHEANQQLDSGFELKAVFVTFNTQGERAACQAACRKRWISSWFQPRAERFLGKYRFWVEQAKPPEDYIYENLHYTRLARFFRTVLVRLIVLAILLISAAVATKLMAINISASRNVIWQEEAMTAEINTAMQVYPLNSTQSPLAPDAANATYYKIISAVGETAAAPLHETAAFKRLGYCSLQLQQRCSEKLGQLLKTKLSMQPAEQASWADPADSFLKSKDFYSKLQDCSEQGTSCTFSMCYPCYCHLLSKVAPARVVESEWVFQTRQQCSAYINTLDVKSYGMKAVISAVIVILNITLKQVLQVLVGWEKHWTQSDREQAYAVLAFVSQLLNSVLVLLLVNAQSNVSAALNAKLNSSQQTSWGANLILSGAYADFSPSWYVDVGQSLEIIVILNAVLTAFFAWLDWVIRKLRQSCLTNIAVSASQSMYNSAWQGLNFVLDYRVSDMMLGLWIILMFGSGMPGLYIYGIIWLVVVDLTDRWYIARMCQQPVRYGKHLPYLLLGVLPWAAATHCAFGLWMHTRFYAGSDQSLTDFANEGGSNIALLAQSDIGRRITQLNGLPLLILLIVHLTIHTLIRSLLYFFSGKAFKCCCSEQEDGPEIEVTYESALAATYGKGGGHRKLAGTPTYRMPHHPRYRDMFDNAMYKPVWFKAFGRLRYTQLVSRPGGGFQIAPEVILEHDQTDMEETIASMPENLQHMARKLADGESADGKPRKSLKPRTSLAGVLTGVRDRSQSISVAVLAGMAADSPTAARQHSASFAASPTFGARMSSITNADGTPASPGGGSFLQPNSPGPGSFLQPNSPGLGSFLQPGSPGGFMQPGSFSVSSARMSSFVAPESVVMSQQGFMGQPPAEYGIAGGYPGMYSANPEPVDPRALAMLPPGFASSGPDSTAAPQGWYPEGMYAAAAGSMPVTAGTNNYPADFGGGAEIEPYAPYDPSNPRQPAQISNMPMQAGLGAAGYPGMLLGAQPTQADVAATAANAMMPQAYIAAMGDGGAAAAAAAAAVAAQQAAWFAGGPDSQAGMPVKDASGPSVIWNPLGASLGWPSPMAGMAAAAAAPSPAGAGDAYPAAGAAAAAAAGAGGDAPWLMGNPVSGTQESYLWGGAMAAAAAHTSGAANGTASFTPYAVTMSGGSCTSQPAMFQSAEPCGPPASGMFANSSSSTSYPAFNLNAFAGAGADAAAAYPNVHLTTVEMPAPYAAPAYGNSDSMSFVALGAVTHATREVKPDADAVPAPYQQQQQYEAAVNAQPVPPTAALAGWGAPLEAAGASTAAAAASSDSYGGKMPAEATACAAPAVGLVAAPAVPESATTDSSTPSSAAGAPWETVQAGSSGDVPQGAAAAAVTSQAGTLEESVSVAEQAACVSTGVEVGAETGAAGIASEHGNDDDHKGDEEDSDAEAEGQQEQQAKAAAQSGAGGAAPGTSGGGNQASGSGGKKRKKHKKGKKGKRG